jgi:hypothetical protein
MSSAQVRSYLVTLSASEQKRVSTELYRAMLSMDMRENGGPQQQFSTSSTGTLEGQN